MSTPPAPEPQGGQYDCDEYPMASTSQGAATSDGHYSARVIPEWDNENLGRRIGAWYGTQRILHDDPFFIKITKEDDGYDGGGQGGVGGVPGAATSVNAGPDVTGDEGSPVTLLGSVRSLSGGAASARWTSSVVDAAPAALARAATGPTWHHLTGRYYNGSTTPSGRAALWVPGTSLRLEARDLEWLVVTPDGKTAAKGTGSVDNRPGYGFVMYGYQGCAQAPPPCSPGAGRVRTLVWPLSEGLTPGSGTMFDNSPVADFDVDVADPRTMSEGQVLISRP